LGVSVAEKFVEEFGIYMLKTLNFCEKQDGLGLAIDVAVTLAGASTTIDLGVVK